MRLRNSKGEMKTPSLEAKGFRNSYRGYEISRGPMSSHFAVRKHGKHIGYARTYDEAVELIERLDPEKL
jgi:hypothetical protein